MLQVVGDCSNCGMCAANCPDEAIDEAANERHAIDNAKCVECRTCMKLCPMNAIKEIK